MQQTGCSWQWVAQEELHKSPADACIDDLLDALVGAIRQVGQRPAGVCEYLIVCARNQARQRWQRLFDLQHSNTCISNCLGTLDLAYWTSVHPGQVCASAACEVPAQAAHAWQGSADSRSGIDLTTHGQHSGACLLEGRRRLPSAEVGQRPGGVPLHGHLAGVLQLLHERDERPCRQDHVSALVRVACNVAQGPHCLQAGSTT